MRASIWRHSVSFAQRYLQYPPTHAWFAPQSVPPGRQFGFGRVSTAQAPWLHQRPAPHSPSCAHAGVHAPSRQRGALAGHSAFDVHALPTGLGTHTPLAEQVEPAAHGFVASQPARQRPLAQICPAPHSLENWQTSEGAVHAPATH